MLPQIKQVMQRKAMIGLVGVVVVATSALLTARPPDDPIQVRGGLSKREFAEIRMAIP